MTASDVIAVLAGCLILVIFVLMIVSQVARDRRHDDGPPMNCEGCPFPIAGDCDRPCDQAEQ